MKLPKTIDQYLSSFEDTKCRLCQVWDFPQDDEYDNVLTCNICNHCFFICVDCKTDIYYYRVKQEPEICMLCDEKARYRS